MNRPTVVLVAACLVLAWAAFNLLAGMAVLLGIGGTPALAEAAELMDELRLSFALSSWLPAVLWATAGIGLLKLHRFAWPLTLVLAAALAFVSAVSALADLVSQQSQVSRVFPSLAGLAVAVAILVLVLTRSARRAFAPLEPRPLGVSILAVLYFLNAVILATTLFGIGAGAQDLVGAVAFLLVIALLVVVLIPVALGGGLWELRDWGRRLVIGVHVLALVAALILTMAGQANMLGVFLFVVLSGVVIWYLLRPQIRASFGPEKSAAAA